MVGEAETEGVGVSGVGVAVGVTGVRVEVGAGVSVGSPESCVTTAARTCPERSAVGVAPACPQPASSTAAKIAERKILRFICGYCTPLAQPAKKRFTAGVTS